jgi:hypothetical protein
MSADALRGQWHAPPSGVILAVATSPHDRAAIAASTAPSSDAQTNDDIRQRIELPVLIFYMNFHVN